jgi:hypothetical protein
MPMPNPDTFLPSCSSPPPPQVDWFMTAEQEASTEALAHRWDPSPAAGLARLEAFLRAVRGRGGGVGERGDEMPVCTTL